jgi:hypothetical protein
MRTGLNDRKDELRNILTGWLRRRVNERYENERVRLRSGNAGRREPLFKNGDSVYERFPMKDQLCGIIVRTYIFDGQYRYVVHFGDGRESVLFEKELTSAFWRTDIEQDGHRHPRQTHD